MKNIVILITFLLLVPWPVYSDDSKFCNDPPHWEHFNNMVAESPDDIPLQILHALKIGLCVKIEQNSISTQQAIGLFYDMIDTAANKRGENEEQEDTQKPKEF